MNSKKNIFCCIIALFSGILIAYSNNLPNQINKSKDFSWKSIPGKDQGEASFKNGVLTLSSDSDLFYIHDKSPELFNTSISYNIKSLNENSHTGVILRYISPNDWIYIGCDETSDILGYSVWYVETPSFRKEIARDIAKLYKDFSRNIRIDLVDESILLRIDSEIASSVNIPGLEKKAGKIGFRAHKGGAAIISDITFKEMIKPKTISPKGTFSIQSDDLQVVLSRSFPTPLRYKWENNPEIIVNDQVCEYINLNGDLFPVQGSGRQIDENTVSYILEVPEVNVVITVECCVKQHIFETCLKEIKVLKDLKEAFPIKTIGFPEQYLAAMPNSSKKTALSIAVNEGSDRFFPLNKKTADTINYNVAIVILNDENQAITLDNNSIYETKQFFYRSVSEKNATFIGNNEWIYRGIDGKTTELPWWKVIFTSDRNNDGIVNWQDGAVALSEVYPDPYGVERVRNSNVTITMNFASEAQFPFLRQLDNLKKVYYLTDGFRQMLELKGYQAEGHDTGHPDFSGHYNTRAGGVNELNSLVQEAKKYNAYIGLHINDSEAHPSAKAYNNHIVSEIPGWKWLDQAYLIKKEADVRSGCFQQRLDNLKKEVDGLDFIYIDTYREHRYLAYNTAKLFNERDWAIWTEDPSVFNRYGVWIHYYPESKSLISRFVHGTRKDAFANDSLFGGGYDRGAAIGFQGWQNGKDMYRAIRNFYTEQLPYRYLMQSPVIYADTNKLRFKNGTETRRENGVTNMYDNGRMIKKGNIVFIPWNDSGVEKIYHYNPEGGNTKWELPASWDTDKVYCYELSDTGRMAVNVLNVINKHITLSTKKDVPYVLYKKTAPDLLQADWSHGSPVKDMGFDSKDFLYWKKTGNAEGVQIETTTYGQAELKISGQEKAGVTQTIESLKGGQSYSAYTWVEIQGKRKASLEISGNNFSPVSSSIKETLFKNTQINSDKRGRYYELLKVQFKLPEGQTTAKLSLQADAVKDSSYVIFDDIRVLETQIYRKEGYTYYEDFEHIDFGWGGWMLARPSEAKTHLSERNGIYTDDVIDGNWSLKILDQGKGEILRTMPSLIRLMPNTKYTVRFQYKSTKKGSFEIKAFTTKSKEPLLSSPLDGEGIYEGSFTTDDSGDCYLSIFQLNKGMLIIDNFGIKM